MMAGDAVLMGNRLAIVVVVYGVWERQSVLMGSLIGHVWWPWVGQIRGFVFEPGRRARILVENSEAQQQTKARPGRGGVHGMWWIAAHVLARAKKRTSVRVSVCPCFRASVSAFVRPSVGRSLPPSVRPCIRVRPSVCTSAGLCDCL